MYLQWVESDNNQSTSYNLQNSQNLGMNLQISSNAKLNEKMKNIPHSPGADPRLQVRWAHLKKLRRAEGGAKIVRVFGVKNHDFTPKDLIFSNFKGGGGWCAPGGPRLQVRWAHLKKLRRAEGGAKIVRVFGVKNHDFTPKDLIFSNFRGGGVRRVGTPPPWIRPCSRNSSKIK